MTRNDILTEVYNSQIINKMASKYITRFKGDIDDYISFCLEVVCEIPEDKLIQLYTEGQLYFYIVSIARNQLLNSKSAYNKLMENNIDKMSLNTYMHAKNSEDEF